MENCRDFSGNLWTAVQAYGFTENRIFLDQFVQAGNWSLFARFGLDCLPGGISTHCLISLLHVEEHFLLVWLHAALLIPSLRTWNSHFQDLNVVQLENLNQLQVSSSDVATWLTLERFCRAKGPTIHLFQKIEQATSSQRSHEECRESVCIR